MKKPADVYDALVAAFHGAPLSRGETLTSSCSKQEALPLLQWEIGAWKESVWTPEESRIQWTLPVKLTVRSEQANPRRLLEVISDVSDWCYAIYGLPVDEDNNIIPVFEDQLEAFRAGEIKPIADRFAGPFMDGFAGAPMPDGDVYTAALTFRLEMTIMHPQPPTFTIKQFVLGLQPLDPAYQKIGYNPNKPFRLQSPLAKEAETYSRTPYVDPETLLATPSGDRLFGSFPPLLPEYKNLAGPDPATNLVRADVIPAATTLSVGVPTRKLDAIGYFQDGSTIRLDTVSAWSSGSPLVATVGADGTITRVGSGTAVITAQYNGLSATSTVTVS